MIDRDRIHDAVDLLRDGGLVLFPTETGLMLGACADRPESTARLRARGGELSLLLGPRAPFAEWVVWSATARQIAARCWPGPLHLVLDASARVPAMATRGGAVRVAVPSHPVAVALLDAYIDGVVATPVLPGLPVGASATLEALGFPTDTIPTVLDLRGDRVVVLAEGAVPLGALSEWVLATAPTPG